VTAFAAMLLGTIVYVVTFSIAARNLQTAVDAKVQVLQVLRERGLPRAEGRSSAPPQVSLT
jgi:hypothetical protein